MGCRPRSPYGHHPGDSVSRTWLKVLPFSDTSILMSILYVKVCGYVVGVRGKYTITFHLFADFTSS